MGSETLRKPINSIMRILPDHIYIYIYVRFNPHPGFNRHHQDDIPSIFRIGKSQPKHSWLWLAFCCGGGRSNIYDFFGTFSLTVASETWSDRSDRSPAEAIALCPTCPVRPIEHITEVIALWWKNAGNNLVFECQSICTPRSYKKHKVSSMSNNYVYRIPFRSCLKHCLTVEMVKVQNGFPDHKASNRLWLLSSPGFWQSYIYQEPKDDLFFEGQPSKRRDP